MHYVYGEARLELSSRYFFIAHHNYFTSFAYLSYPSVRCMWYWNCMVRLTLAEKVEERIERNE